MKKVLALVLALTMVLGMEDDPSNILPGLWKIMITEDALITDYMEIAGRQRHPDHADRPDHHRYRHRHRPAGREHC